MKKYKDLYEEEKQRHEEALQRYQEDHTDEMKIISLHKSAARRLGRFHRKKHQGQMNLKKYQGPLMIQAGKKKQPKKAPSNRKKTTT